MPRTNDSKRHDLTLALDRLYIEKRGIYQMVITIDQITELITDEATSASLKDSPFQHGSMNITP